MSAGVIGYGLHPETFPGVVTVCVPCLPPEQADKFEAAYDSDALGEITGYTISDESPVYCDVCRALMHPGVKIYSED